MKYMLMCCFDEQQWNRLPESQREAIMQEYGELIRNLHESGQHLSSTKLQPSLNATTIRGGSGDPAVTDGPFAETKEQLGGYHLVECHNLDEAIAIAKRIPTIPFGGTIEVRPLEERQPEP